MTGPGPINVLEAIVNAKLAGNLPAGFDLLLFIPRY